MLSPVLLVRRTPALQLLRLPVVLWMRALLNVLVRAAKLSLCGSGCGSCCCFAWFVRKALVVVVVVLVLVVVVALVLRLLLQLEMVQPVPAPVWARPVLLLRLPVLLVLGAWWCWCSG